MTQEIIDKGCKLALEEAEKSPCKKRKVGAVIVTEFGEILSKGYNHIPAEYLLISKGCEDDNGKTHSTVVHAEIDAIIPMFDYKDCTIFVTHQPCENCQTAIDKAGLKVHLVEQFMKFDTGKLRYGLIPPEATKALASVLTYGAKKYKPNNWQKAEDTERYVDALYRHLESWRSGEEFDEESKLSHLSHALTNIAFLVYFEKHKARMDNRSGPNND